MRTFLLGFSAALLLGTAVVGSLHGQDPPVVPPVEQAPACTPLTGSLHAVCQAAHDAVFATVPAWSVLIGGGNPILGTAAAGGKFASITLTFRVTQALIVLPTSEYDGSSDTVHGVRRIHRMQPSVDLAFGLLQKAMPMGTVGVDFLSTVFLIQPDGIPLLSFPDDTRRIGGRVVGFGWGIRIGMAPKGPMPSASLSVTMRDHPHFTYGDIAAGSTYSYTLGVSAMNVRLMAGRRFGGFEFTAGAGVDMLKGKYSIVYTDPATGALQPQVDSTRSGMRIITTANAALHLKMVRVTFEGGYQVGKDELLPTVVQSVNSAAGRFFAGAGLAVRF